MKINESYPGVGNNGQQRIERIDRATAGESSAAGQVDRRSDQVQVSSIGREVQYYLEITRGLPDVREAKVEALKGQFDSGQYEVDAQRLAQRIIEYGDVGDFLL